MSQLPVLPSLDEQMRRLLSGPQIGQLQSDLNWLRTEGRPLLSAAWAVLIKKWLENAVAAALQGDFAPKQLSLLELVGLQQGSTGPLVLNALSKRAEFRVRNPRLLLIASQEILGEMGYGQMAGPDRSFEFLEFRPLRLLHSPEAEPPDLEEDLLAP